MNQRHELLLKARRAKTLEEAFRWGMAQDPRIVPTDVIGQDEYTNDVIFRAGDDCYLVFDSTWLGAVQSVSVWDHAPTANELLHSRLKSGWTPTASELRGGPQILGHAACLVAPNSVSPRNLMVTGCKFTQTFSVTSSTCCKAVTTAALPGLKNGSRPDLSGVYAAQRAVCDVRPTSRWIAHVVGGEAC